MDKSHGDAFSHSRQSQTAPTNVDDCRHSSGAASDRRPDWLSRLLRAIAYRAALNPKGTLLATVVLTVVAAVLALTQLEFRTSRLDLLSDSAAYNQRWLKYLDQFGHDDDAVVVVSHVDPKRVSDVLLSVGQRLESDAQLSGVLYRKSVGAVADKALHLMPAVELEQLDQLLSACLRLLGQNRQEQFAAAATSPTGTATDDVPMAGMAQQLSSAMTQAQSGLEQLRQAVPKAGPLLLEDEGKLGICLVRLPHADDKPREAQALLACLNTHLDALRSQNADVDIWLTGMPVLEWDESQSSQRDMRNATLLSLIGVAAIFIFGFGSWRMPCAAVVCLAIGLIWTVGLTTLCIGHLNLFSVAFGAIVAGLGIDYAIHVLTHLQTDTAGRFEPDLPRRLADAIGKCGKGVFTGAVTTAAAFAVAMLTPFRGMTELGLICALGTLCCMGVTICVLPALIALQTQWLPSAKGTPSEPGLLMNFHSATNHWLAQINRWLLHGRFAVVASALAITGAAAMQIGQVHYDHNLLNLQADDVPSVHAERELTRRSGQSAWFAISLASSPQQALAMHQRLSALPSVARVEDIGSVIASGQSHPRSVQLVAACRAHAEQLGQQLNYQAAPTLAASPPALRPLAAIPSRENVTVRTVSHTGAAAFDPALDAALASQMHSLSKSVCEMAAADAPTLADFPAAVRQRMASQDGQTFLLRIFARENLWQRDNLARFVEELESVDPRVTGHPIQTWYASGELEESYYQAGIYALLIVAALLMLDLGSVRLVLLALLPVGISSLQLCGLMVWLEIPFNAANMIVLPLILGIGVDDGVHIVHEFHARRHQRFRLSSGATLAVLLTSLTTMVGFGSMGMADHRGLQSLGIVLLLGVGLCLLNSWFTLPAVLSYFPPQLPAPNAFAEPTVLPNPKSRAAALERTASDHCHQDTHSPMAIQDIPVMLSLPNYPDV